MSQRRARPARVPRFAPLAFALLALACSGLARAQPVLVNPSFEEVDGGGRPAGWSGVAWGADGVDATRVCRVLEVGAAPDGRRVAGLSPDTPTHCAWAQGLDGLEPGQWYEASVMLRCEALEGNGCFLNIEFWPPGVEFACGVDSEHLVGTVDWQRAAVRFIAPASDYRVKFACYSLAGGPGRVYFDDARIRRIEPPHLEHGQRRVLDGPFWGMFTCYANYLHQYGKDMAESGVYWQRQGGSATAREQQEIAARLNMAYPMCLDGMPKPKAQDDPCWPITSTPEYLAYLHNYLAMDLPTVRVWELFNEPNTRLGWTLPAYSNLQNMVGREIKRLRPAAIVATGGFACPAVGQVEALLKRDPDKSIDMALVHPYGVDEGLDSHLYALGEAARAAGRPELALAINETGWATWDPATGLRSHPWFVSEARQASNVVKLHVQALAHRLSFVTYLGWNDLPPGLTDVSSNMGLVRLDGSPKPAYHAYRFMTRTIGDRRVERWTYGPEGTRIYRLTGDPPLWIVWNALRQTTASIDAGDHPVFPCDLYGVKQTTLPIRGHVAVTAALDPVYLVGIASP